MCGIHIEEGTEIYDVGTRLVQASHKVKIEIPIFQEYCFTLRKIELNQVSKGKYNLIYKNPQTGDKEVF